MVRACVRACVSCGSCGREGRKEGVGIEIGKGGREAGMGGGFDWIDWNQESGLGVVYCVGRVGMGWGGGREMSK